MWSLYVTPSYFKAIYEESKLRYYVKIHPGRNEHPSYLMRLWGSKGL